jgi:elongation factor Ts
MTVVINAESVRQLREATGAGMMDCKKALTETGNNFEEATLWLRKKGLAAAAKKADRTAAEGLIGLATTKDGRAGEGALVEINAETDFIATNEEFQGLVSAAATLAVTAKGDADGIKAGKTPSGSTVEEVLTHLVAKIGENMQLRRTTDFQINPVVVVGYIHNAVAPGLGKMGVLVVLESEANQDELEALGKQLAMHVAAANPQSISPDSLPAEVVERERSILRDQAASSGKPAEVIEKMIVGRLQKFYEESVLLEQSLVMDPSIKVKDHIDAFAKASGKPVKVVDFIRFVLGEGIERAANNFAEEVAAQMRA